MTTTPAAASSPVIDHAEHGGRLHTGMEHRADSHRREDAGRVESEHVALAARIVGDHDTSSGGVLDPSGRLLVEQPTPEARRSLTDDESVHPHRAGTDRGAQTRRAELEPAAETIGEIVVGRSVAGVGRLDQRRELGVQVVIGFGSEPFPCGVEGVGVMSSPTKRMQLDERTRAHVADHLGGSDRTESATLRDVGARGEAMEESGGEEIARSGRVDDGRHRDGGHLDELVARDHHASLRPAGDDGHRAFVAQRGHGVVERLQLVQRQQLVFVAEEQVDAVGDETAEVVTMAIDAERVGQRQRHGAVVLVRNLRGMAERRLGIVAIVEVALHVEHLALGDGLLVEIVDAQHR